MKLFTVESANRTLPLVRKIVADIVRNYETWQDGVRELEVLAAGARSDETDARVLVLEREVAGLAADVQGCLRELEALGVEFKGFDIGLVDFPSEMGDRRVYLCWQLGEASVAHWHEMDAGYAGRQPLTPAEVS